jgi:hypothetical protein
LIATWGASAGAFWPIPATFQLRDFTLVVEEGIRFKYKNQFIMFNAKVFFIFCSSLRGTVIGFTANLPRLQNVFRFLDELAQGQNMPPPINLLCPYNDYRDLNCFYFPRVFLFWNIDIDLWAGFFGVVL